VTEPVPPGPEHPPDHVLEELLGAFSTEAPTEYNFDDPSIDRLLGITDEHLQSAHAADADDVDDDRFDDPADELDGDELDADALDIEALDIDALDAGEFDASAFDELAAGAPLPDGAVPVDDVAPPKGRKGKEPSASVRRTIVIAEDDRPDSVYLDEDKEKAFHERREALDDSGERSTIVIADLDEVGSSEPPLARSRGGGIDPRIRARRISVRRAEGRRRLLWVGIAAGVVLLAIGAIAVFASTVFDVRTVTVQGATYTDKDVLDGVIADLRGKPILLVDTKKAEQALEAVPWVERAQVTTDFPHTVLVDIRERHAVATFQGGGDHRWRVIDVDGRVLDILANQPADYTLIAGTNPDTDRGQFAGAIYASAANLVQSLPAEVRTITQSVGVDAQGNLTMQLTGAAEGTTVQVRLGDTKGLDEKLARLLHLLRQGLDGVCALDVSTSDAGAVAC